MRLVDAEAKLKFDIGAIVDITLAVSEKVRAKYDLELELVNDELAEANAEIERLQAKVEAMELLGDFEAIQADIDKLTEQKERQAKTIQELMEKLEAAEKRAGNAILESVDAGAVSKQKEEIRRLEEMNEKLKAENKELTKKLKEAEQRGDAVVRRSENWIRPSEEEAWNNGRREALRETGATVTALEAANKVLGEKLEKAEARIEELETNQETEPEPKPCPFCGKEPRIYGEYIACVNEDCPVNPETTFFPTREEAIEAWNRRA